MERRQKNRRSSPTGNKQAPSDIKVIPKKENKVRVMLPEVEKPAEVVKPVTRSASAVKAKQD